MVAGIDVTYPFPGPTKKTAPSVVAMLVRVDKEVLLFYFPYVSSWMEDMAGGKSI